VSQAIDELYSCTVLDAEGSRIGGVSQVYLDDATGEPTFVVARAGLFGNREVLIPLTGAFASDGLLQVPHPAEVIKQAPPPPPDQHLTPTHEAQAYRHYGVGFVIPPAVPPPADPSADFAEDAPADQPDLPL